jgi:hypothetical protein
LTIVTIALLGGVGVACADENETSPSTPTVPAQTAVQGSGIEIIDTIVDAAERGDTGALIDLVQFEMVACVAGTPAGPGGPPLCRAGEPAGTRVSVALFGLCELVYVREDAISFESFRLDASQPVYAAYRLPDRHRSRDLWPNAEYTVVGIRASGDAVLTSEFVADDEGIVGVLTSCSAYNAPAEYVAEQGYLDVLIAPAP